MNESTPALDFATVEAIRNKLREQLASQDMMHSAGRGIAVGGALAGAALLARGLSSSLQRNPSTYTEPVETVVYRPDEVRRRRRKLAEFDWSALNPFAKSPELAGSPEISKLLDSTGYGGIDWWEYARRGVPLALGIPAGFYAAKKLTDTVKGIARHSELQSAQNDFEQALQEYAESADQPKKVDVIRRKLASLSEEQALVYRLAENCTELSKEAVFGTAAKGLAAWVALSPLLAGVYGFNSHWDNRKFKDLEIAERQLNLQREKTNPTFAVATLKSPPDLNGSTKDTEDDEPDELLRQAVENSYRTDYM